MLIIKFNADYGCSRKGDCSRKWISNWRPLGIQQLVRSQVAWKIYEQLRYVSNKRSEMEKSEEAVVGAKALTPDAVSCASPLVVPSVSRDGAAAPMYKNIQAVIRNTPFQSALCSSSVRWEWQEKQTKCHSESSDVPVDIRDGTHEMTGCFAENAKNGAGPTGEL